MDEKKKRGRPKKIVEQPVSPDIDDPNRVKKKRGRKKKTEVVYQLPLPITSNTREESNYLVMLDIKYADLDTTVNEPTKKLERLVCDELVESFAQLIQQRRSLYENDPVLNSIHEKIVAPENCKTDFYSSYDNQEKNLAVLPIFKANGEGWPTYSPYCCWNCDSQFENAPVGIPEVINNGQFYCSGNFCSFGCAGRYIIDSDHSVNRFDRLSMLNMLYQMTYDLDVTEFVKVANPKQALHKYGGCQSYSQYHDTEASRKVELYKLPIIPIYYFICNDSTNEEEVEELNKEVITINEGGMLPP